MRAKRRLPSLGDKYDRATMQDIVRIIIELIQTAQSDRENIVVGADRGLYLRSPDGTYWKLTVDNLGALGTTAVTNPDLL